MAYKCSPMTLRLVFLSWWIRALTVHRLLHFQLGGRGGTHTPRRTLITAAPGICNLPAGTPNTHFSGLSLILYVRRFANVSLRSASKVDPCIDLTTRSSTYT